MKKNLLLYFIIVFLIVVNGFFLFEHFRTSDKGEPQRRRSPNFIAAQLEFDTTQLQKFEELDEAHRKKINTIRGKIKASKEALFDKTSDESFDNAEVEAIAIQIATMEKAKALETFRFFNSVSELCNENQRKRWHKIIKDGLQRQGPPGGNRPPDSLGPEHRPPPPPRD